MQNAILTGKITDIFPAEPITERFEKRVFRMERREEKFTHTYELEFYNRACQDLDSYKVGQAVECEVEIRGRKAVTKQGEERVYTTLSCKGMRRI